MKNNAILILIILIFFYNCSNSSQQDKFNYEKKYKKLITKFSEQNTFDQFIISDDILRINRSIIDPQMGILTLTKFDKIKNAYINYQSASLIEILSKIHISINNFNKWKKILNKNNIIGIEKSLGNKKITIIYEYDLSHSLYYIPSTETNDIELFNRLTNTLNPIPFNLVAKCSKNWFFVDDSN